MEKGPFDTKMAVCLKVNGKWVKSMDQANFMERTGMSRLDFGLMISFKFEICSIKKFKSLFRLRLDYH